ncbi:TPA: hypothetical protein UM521_004393 [Stenotrophomonas maltophilia]|uniref:hypothetical protein n=1 Tax=Stenotrophomonas maltophilia group TaxID=995085 RepID=UPI000A6F82DE|nr:MULTISPECIES: hypothetical protein [Stenotrophomonas]EKT4096548.1 hypothetical protein [Stenotrophomonas maltophilia]MBC9114582.1 hypothetical protein [Stenotrophomonas maltophilia]MBH1381361.1 hypothetical protein [Stenotrophomonas maltophilia]MBH1395785.1 hypothetical protein [Stenotrophomonas maltophilia]MBH1466676.1 hypothetical protein [Stenotrophomonas maltophilia]
MQTMITGILLRRYFSLTHAQMAAFNARAASVLNLDGSELSSIAMSAHVSGSVISAGAFIEATANEIAESDSRPRRNVAGMPSSLLRLNEIIEDAGAVPIEHSDSRWIAARTLIDLRNRLIHYQHDWLDSGTENMVGPGNLYSSELLERLQASFEFLPTSEHKTPRFLSPDCAAWATSSAIDFLDEFYRRLGKTPNHDHLRNSITVERPLAAAIEKQV